MKIKKKKRYIPTIKFVPSSDRPKLYSGAEMPSTVNAQWQRASARRWASAEAEAESIISQISLDSESGDDENTEVSNPKKQVIPRRDDLHGSRACTHDILEASSFVSMPSEKIVAQKHPEQPQRCQQYVRLHADTCHTKGSKR